MAKTIWQHWAAAHQSLAPALPCKASPSTLRPWLSGGHCCDGLKREWKFEWRRRSSSDCSSNSSSRH
ncbi:hypothetical protein O3P69_010223 [Scylla paramamosain]|uniref:Uncharacterized protein n=1 Tax=Scylla paramamosain TaxID=85552 RepID=A0AAW0TS45_SCYPA